jgi:hypothetical protein
MERAGLQQVRYQPIKKGISGNLQSIYQQEQNARFEGDVMNQIKSFYSKAQKYNIPPYLFDQMLMSEKFEIFNRVQSGKFKGKIIGLNRKAFKEAAKVILKKLRKIGNKNG